MAVPRKAIPKSVREQVMNEFSHRCAVCAKDKPQIHHIDENPSNNDRLNLIPLCPNCHLTDQHDPTAQMDPRKLSLFRQYRDPTILKPQFHPLFIRTRFLDDVTDTSDASELVEKANQLVEFVANLEMGAFYSKRIAELLGRPSSGWGFIIGDPVSEGQFEAACKEGEQAYRQNLQANRDTVMELVVELLRYQSW